MRLSHREAFTSARESLASHELSLLMYSQVILLTGSPPFLLSKNFSVSECKDTKKFLKNNKFRKNFHFFEYFVDQKKFSSVKTLSYFTFLNFAFCKYTKIFLLAKNKYFLKSKKFKKVLIFFTNLRHHVEKKIKGMGELYGILL